MTVQYAVFASPPLMNSQAKTERETILEPSASQSEFTGLTFTSGACDATEAHHRNRHAQAYAYAEEINDV